MIDLKMFKKSKFLNRNSQSDVRKTDQLSALNSASKYCCRNSLNSNMGYDKKCKTCSQFIRKWYDEHMPSWINTKYLYLVLFVLLMAHDRTCVETCRRLKSNIVTYLSFILVKDRSHMKPFLSLRRVSLENWKGA